MDSNSITYWLAHMLGYSSYSVVAWCRDFMAVVRIGQEDAGRNFFEPDVETPWMWDEQVGWLDSMRQGEHP